MASFSIQKDKKNDKIVNVLAIAIPVAVALLIGIRQKIDLGSWTKILPQNMIKR